MARTYSVGTASVANGSTTVTIAGGVMSPMNCDEDFDVIIEGQPNYVASRTDTTHFELVMPHEGAGGSGLSYAIRRITAIEKSTMALNGRLAEVLSLLSARSGLAFAVTSDTVAFSAGAGKFTWRAPMAFELAEVRASVKTASTSGSITIDINVNGTSILSTKLTIDQGEKTSKTAATPYVLSNTLIEDDDEITIDIDGAGANAVGLKVTLYPVEQQPDL